MRKEAMNIHPNIHGTHHNTLSVTVRRNLLSNRCTSVSSVEAEDETAARQWALVKCVYNEVGNSGTLYRRRLLPERTDGYIDSPNSLATELRICF